MGRLWWLLMASVWVRYGRRPCRIALVVVGLLGSFLVGAPASVAGGPSFGPSHGAEAAREEQGTDQRESDSACDGEHSDLPA
jgi:hypothetical protein